MANWTQGYQTTVDYTYGYYKELSPTFQQFCLLLNGIEVDSLPDTATHCELGFGQGVSLTIHAASHPAQFYGTDFNPAHAAHASQFARQGDISQHFYDDSFEELLSRADLPMFDSIGLHGIWSWISHENQHIVLQFIRKHLKPNGILYISYNNLIGWATNMPIRELLYSHFAYASQSTNPLSKVQEALTFSENMLNQKPAFAKHNPVAMTKIQDLKKSDFNYLIHEYMNQDWQCFSFQQINRLMEDIKLTFACSLDLNQFFEEINLTQEQQQFLDGIQAPVLKEQCRDYFYQNTFRRDLFVRGKRSLTAAQAQHKLRNMAFVMLKSAKTMPTKVNGLLGEFDLLPEIYVPIYEEFAKADYQPLTLAELEEKLPNLNYGAILNALIMLFHLNLVSPCQTTSPNQKLLKQCHKINHYILEQSVYHQRYQVLATPITGMGFPINYYDQLFFRAYFLENLDTPSSISKFSQTELEKTGQFLLDAEGKAITEKKESLALFKSKAQAFLEEEKPTIARQLRLFA